MTPLPPTRGALLRLTGLYAYSFILGRHQTYVIDGEAAFTYYQPLSRRPGGGPSPAREVGRPRCARGRAATAESTGSAYGGEGSVRGVEYDAIHVPGGGRLGLNMRGELRYQRKQLRSRWLLGSGAGLAQAKPSDLVGHGRWLWVGAALRFGLSPPARHSFQRWIPRATNLTRNSGGGGCISGRRFYFSIGQAF